MPPTAYEQLHRDLQQFIPAARLIGDPLRTLAYGTDASLYRLIDQTAESHQPILIVGQRNNAVLVSAEDWQAIQETLYRLSVPVDSGGAS